jgi:hypothetical protein
MKKSIFLYDKATVWIERSWKPILLIIFGSNLLYFIFISYKYLAFNSDSASKVLIASEIFNSHSFFPKDWAYVNNDLWITTAHVFVVPLLRFLPPGYLSHAIACSLMGGLIIFSIWWLINSFQIGVAQKTLIILMCLGGISLTITESMFGQVSYGILLMFSVLLIKCLGLYDFNSAKKNLIYYFLTLLIVLLMVIGNPMRAVPYYLFPIACSVIFLLICGCQQQRIRESVTRSLIFVGSLVIVCAAGFLIHKILVTHVNMQQGVTTLRWISLSEMLDKVPKLFASFITILGGEPYANRALSTTSGVYDGFRLLVALLFIGILPRTITFCLLGKDKLLQLMAIYALTSLFALSVLMLGTSVFNARYLIPPVFLLVIAAAALPFKFRENIFFDTMRLVVALGFCTNLLVINTSYWSTYHTSEIHKADAQNFDYPSELAQLLLDNNLQYGFGTFWQANVVTVLTDNKVKTRPIYIENGRIFPMKWLSASSWYAEAAARGETFLILSAAEALALNWDSFASARGLNPFKTIQFKHYTVFIFSENITEKLLH